MHALSVRQPFAEQIASGLKRNEFRTWAPRSIVGRDLLIVASKIAEPGGEHLPRGVAVCVVGVESMVELSHESGMYSWRLSSPRRVEPIAIKGSAALYRVPDEVIVQLASSTPATMPRGEVARTLRAAGRGIARENARRGPFSFQDGDRVIRGERAATMAEARARARELADRIGDYVYIMRDGINVGGEWHAAERGAAE